tara:strand:+ start:807 stop:1490 length:684 start_codon:yes stop_codon:yes gene_type:complete
MDISEKNRNNIISRWNKIHEVDKEYIRKNSNKFLHLKSRICGFIAGDGNILVDNGSTCRHNTVRFFPDNLSLVKSYGEAILKVYNKIPKIVEKENYFYMTLDSKPVVLDLLSYCEFGKMEWTIPDFVYESEENKIEWLKSFFDCEAYVNGKSIVVKSVNGKSLLKVKELVESFGIETKIYSYNPKNKKWNINYMLYILRKESRRKYRDLIGFNHSTKLKKLNIVLQS